MINKENLRIIFIGTPTFAATILQKIIDEKFNVVAVITAPDRAAGRGLQLQSSEVKKVAVQNNIVVLQPEKLKDPTFLEILKSYEATIQIVVAFRMLPELVWNMPPLGTFNIHASLLPNYRGAAPIHWAVINGEEETGNTTFKLKHEIDTGNIFLQQKIKIAPTDTTGILHDKLMHNGAELVVQTLEAIISNNIVEKEQIILQNEALKHAPKIFTETCVINWNNSCKNIYNFIRGMNPSPTAFTTFQNKKLKIFSASKEENINAGTAIGQYESDGKTYLKFACLDGFIVLKDIQLEGKKRMNVEDFLRGIKLD